MFLDFVRVIFHLIIMADVTSTAERYFETAKKSKWTDATRMCNMSIPDIHVGPDGYMAKFEHEIKHYEVWVGYYRMPTAFEYVDCVKIDRQQNRGVNISQTARSPGLCYKTCGYKELIGVSNDECICLEKDSSFFTSFKINCTSSCNTEGEEGIVCGGEGHMSVYRVIRKDTFITGVSDQACSYFERISDGTNRLTWESCSFYCMSLCENGTGVTSIDDTNRPWKGAVINCFKNGLRPASWETLGRIQGVTTPSWSGVISSKVIFTYKDWSGRNTYRNIQFGYMTKDKQIRFTVNDTEKNVLCQATPPFAQQSTTSTSTEYVLSATTIGQGTDVSVIVGASVSVVLVVTTVVIVVVCLIRRRKNPGLIIKLAKKAKSPKAETGQAVKLQDKIGSPSKEADELHLKLERDNLSEEASGNDYVNNYQILGPRDKASAGYDNICFDENTTTGENENVNHDIDGDNNAANAQVYINKVDMPSGDDYESTASAVNPRTKPVKVQSKATYTNISQLPGNASSTEKTYTNISHLPGNASSTEKTYNMFNLL